MAEMGDGEGATAVIDGFSIDDVVDEAPPQENTVIDARTTTVAVGEDPLSALTSDMSLAPNVATNSQDIHGTPGGARRSSLTALTDEQVSHQQIATPTLADVRATASGFASSLSTFAQKAAHSVAQAAAGPNAMPTSATMTPATAAGGPATSFAPTTRIIPHVELDNDQKEALIKEHMGALLPGERVIMFLSNLLHLSDSAGWDYTNSTGSGMWCCCMTYYRVVLFYSSATEDATNVPTAARPDNWDPDCWPAPEAQPTILQMPLASMDRVEKSIYTTANNTTLMGLVMYG